MPDEIDSKSTALLNLLDNAKQSAREGPTLEKT